MPRHFELSPPYRRLSRIEKFWSAARYWLWDGIKQADNIGRPIKFPSYTLFHLSLLTMLLGAALILWPGNMWPPVTSFLRLWMPEAAWGTIFLVVGRVGMHAMLGTNKRMRCVSAGLLVGCWTFLTTITLCISGVGIGAIVIGFFTWMGAELMKLECRTKC